MKFIKLLNLLIPLFGPHFIHYNAANAIIIGFRKSRDTCMNDGQTIGTINSSSLTNCGLRCLVDQRCLAMSYNFNLKLCKIHDVCYTGCCASGLQDSGWAAYYPVARNCYEILEHRVEDIVGNQFSGFAFTDCALWQNGNITAMNLRISDKLYQIKTKYGDTWSPQHGKWNSGEYIYITFEPGEYITKVITSGDTSVASLHIITNTKEYGIYGTPSGVIKTSQGGKLIFISGRHGGLVDSVSFHWAKQT